MKKIGFSKHLSFFAAVILMCGLLLTNVGAVEARGDVDGDGKINTKDLVLLAQYIAGWNVELCGHYDTTHYDAVDSSCTENGSIEYWECNSCGALASDEAFKNKISTEDISISVKGHTEVKDAAVEATCTDTGLTEGSHCSVCGEVLTEQKEVPAKGHTLNEETGKCDICGTVLVEITPTEGLKYVLINNDTEYEVAGIGTATDTDIVIPSKYNDKPVTRIGYTAFCACDSLTSVTIGDSVTSIGDWAFYGCGSLTSVTIPDSVTSIGEWAFAVCGELPEIKVSADNTTYCDIDGVLFTKDKTTLVCYPAGKSAKSYIIPDSVTSIGDQAFSDCNSLTSVTIPDSVTSIGSGAFYYCDSLTSVTIGDSVTSIGSGAFYYCDSLTSVTIGDSVTSIGDFAFDNCTKLKTVYFTGTEEEWNAITIGTRNDPLLNAEKVFNYVPEGAEPDTPTEPEESPDVTEGLEYVLINNDTEYEVAGIGTATDTDIVIPANYNDKPVTSIGNYAFDSCSSLTSVTIPNSVTRIGADTFRNCSSLTSVTIPDSVTSIGGYAFRSCSSLTSVTIPDSVTSIGSGAFLGCDELSEIKVSADNTAYCDIDGVLFTKDKTTLVCYPEGKAATSYIIPDSVTSIGGYAFYWCNSLTSVTIPDSVTSIGYSAFYNCGAVVTEDGVEYVDNWVVDCDQEVTSVIIREGTVGIGDSAFLNCDSLTSVTIPDSVTSIGNGAFYLCRSLTSVTIPDSVTSISSGAFAYCDELLEIKVSADNTTYCDIDGVLFTKDKTTLVCYPAGKSATSYIIPDSVTSIGNFAFSSCESLTSVAIGDSVTSIGAHAFYDCESLTSVTIGDSVTSIGDDAFNYCDALTSINYTGTKAEWKAIEKSENWNYSTGDYTVYCTDGNLTKAES